MRKDSKHILSFLVMVTIISFAIQVKSQSLFDDDFLNDAEDKSISVGNSQAKEPPRGLDVLRNIAAEADALVNEGEEAAIKSSSPESVILFEEEAVVSSEGSAFPATPAIPDIPAVQEAPDLAQDDVLDRQDLDIFGFKGIGDAQDTITSEMAPSAPAPVSVPDVASALGEAPAAITETASAVSETPAKPLITTALPETSQNKETFNNKKEGYSASEQVIGRISREAFREMADLEKENSLLDLQLRREKLRNDINNVKAVQRQTLLDEIQKRELAARNRIEWEQEQELRKLEIIEKRQKTELLVKQIRGLLEPESQGGVYPGSNVGGTMGNKETVTPAGSIYYIMEISGVGGNLLAKLVNKDEKKIFFARQGSILPSGHEIIEVHRDYVVTTLKGEKSVIGFAIVKENRR